MLWQQLLSPKKILAASYRVNKVNDRSEFERDHNKIIFSPFFRNLQNKTQIFPNPQSDFIHTRLTHSLEVASVGKSLGNLVAKALIEKKIKGLNDNFATSVAEIVSAACLIHDLGNPPFGHAGEDAISNFFARYKDKFQTIVSEHFLNQLIKFNGNAETLRIIHRYHQLNLTCATMSAVIKYPTLYNENSIYQQKYNVFQSETQLLEQIIKECGIVKYQGNYCRHPLAFLVEAADDICYRLLDLEDAYKIGLVKYEQAQELLLAVIVSDNKNNYQQIISSLDNLNEEDKFAKLRSYCVNILIGQVVEKFITYYSVIMSGNYDSLILNTKLAGMLDLIINSDNQLAQSLIKINDYVIKYAYSYHPVLEIELAGFGIINFLLEQFIFAVINNEQSMNQKNQKLINLLPEKFYPQGTVEDKIMKIIDYISGMTDKNAIDLYRKLRGIELSVIR